MGGSGDDAEFGGPRTHRGRVPRPAESSRIPDDTGGANRVTAQRGGGHTRVTATSGTQARHPLIGVGGRLDMSSAERPSTVADGNVWFKGADGERQAIRVDSRDTDGAYAVIESVATPGCAVPTHS